MFLTTQQFTRELLLPPVRLNRSLRQRRHRFPLLRCRSHQTVRDELKILLLQLETNQTEPKASLSHRRNLGKTVHLMISNHRSKWLNENLPRLNVPSGRTLASNVDTMCDNFVTTNALLFIVVFEEWIHASSMTKMMIIHNYYWYDWYYVSKMGNGRAHQSGKILMELSDELVHPLKKTRSFIYELTISRKWRNKRLGETHNLLPLTRKWIC